MLSHKKPDSVINVKVEFGEGEGKVPLDNIAKRAAAYKPKERVTYKMIKEYIEAKYGFKVHTAYIAEVKRELGLPMYDAPNAVEELWYESNIRQILTNEKYIGDALLQKTCTVSILEKKRAKNNGALPKYYVEGCHEAIISRDIFLQVRGAGRTCQRSGKRESTVGNMLCPALFTALIAEIFNAGSNGITGAIGQSSGGA